MMDIFISLVDLFIQQTFIEFTYVGAEEWGGVWPYRGWTERGCGRMTNAFVEQGQA